jgi:hypothetical protein
VFYNIQQPRDLSQVSALHETTGTSTVWKVRITNEMQLTSIGRIVTSRQLLGISNPSIEVIPPTLSATVQL